MSWTEKKKNRADRERSALFSYPFDKLWQVLWQVWYSETKDTVIAAV